MKRRIDGRPQRRKHKALGAKKINGKGSSGCLIALVTFATVAAGWLSMILTSSQTTG